jgi:hypothetical protein
MQHGEDYNGQAEWKGSAGPSHGANGQPWVIQCEDWYYPENGHGLR